MTGAQKRKVAIIGSRITPYPIIYLIRHIAYNLAAKDFLIRSGGAGGADEAAEMGVDSFLHFSRAQAYLMGESMDDFQDLDFKEIFLPWKGFEGNRSPFTSATPLAYEIAARFHPVWTNLTKGQKAFHARNVHQPLGECCDDPVSDLICWTPNRKIIGGSATAILIAEHYGARIHNLATETFDWAHFIPPDQIINSPLCPPMPGFSCHVNGGLGRNGQENAELDLFDAP